jgi:hypothetical protein
MKKTLEDIEHHAFAALQSKGHNRPDTAANCAWLHGAGYNGLKYLSEALRDEVHGAALMKDTLGLDLQDISCAFIFPQVEALRAQHGRLFLRNVRHGLFLLQSSVRDNYGIGCPVDPSFPLGGERSKNPYAEKLDLARAEGVDVDDADWQSVLF